MRHSPLLLLLCSCGLAFNGSTTPPPTTCSNGLPSNAARCSGSTLNSCVITGSNVSESSTVCTGNTPGCRTKTVDAGVLGACCPASVADPEDPACHK